MDSNIKGIYWKLYSTTTLNLIGDAVAVVALPIAFYRETGSVSTAALLGTATAAPAFLLSLPLSAMADRLPRRPVVVASYLGEGLSLLMLMLLLLTHQPLWWLIVLIGVLRGTLSEMAEAANAGYVPMVLGRQALLRYNSRVESVEGLAAIAGPPLAGVVIGLVGGAYGLLVPTALALINAAVFMLLPHVVIPRESPKEPLSIRSIGRDIRLGFRYVLHSRVLRTLVLVNLALGATTGSFVYGVVGHLQSGLEMSSASTGIVMAASGVGGIVGALVLERIFPLARAKHVLLTAFCVVLIVFAAFGSTQGPLSAAILLFILDLAWVGCFIYGGVVEQFLTTDDYLSRVNSITGLAFSAGTVLASGLAALSVDAIGGGGFLQVMAVTALLALAGIWMIRHDKGWKQVT